MVCPYCNSDTKVTNSRARLHGTQVWRRRVCVSCDSIWSTHEIIDLSTSHKVLSRTGQLQPFSRDKLLFSVKSSLRHRETAEKDSTALTDTIFGKILSLKSPTIKTTQIIKISAQVIGNFDHTAGEVYKSLYT